MKAEYGFSDASPNPYAKKLRKLVTMNLDMFAVDYSKREAGCTSIPYQRFINLYLMQCACEQKRIEFV